MSAYIIREAYASEAHILAALEEAAFKEAAWGAESVAGGFEVKGVEVLFCLSRAGAPIGFAIWRDLAGEAELLSIGVDPSVRRSGAGNALVAAVAERAKTAGATAIHLEVDAGNTAARGLYDRTGFVQTGLRRGYYRSGADAVLMCRKI